jgi:hypothetical protein
MNNLSLTAAEIERLIKTSAYVACAIFALITAGSVFLLGASVATAAWRALSPTVLLTSFVFGYFVSSAWRWPRVAAWMRRPLVHGVWAGTLTSDFNRAGKADAARVEVPIVFVIRQTYMTLSVQSFTPGQEGESRLEALIRNEKTEATVLSYVFELRRPYAPEGKLTRGAGELKLVSSDRELRGLYWTDTPTHGSIVLNLVSGDVDGIACYEDALRKWPPIKAVRRSPA